MSKTSIATSTLGSPFDFDILARNLRVLRSSKGLSQAKAAESIGIHCRSLGKYEQGVMTPGLDAAFAIADFYDVTVDELVGRKPISL